MTRSANKIETRLQNSSILSRLTSPLASKKPRNVSEYGIELEEPHKTFAPGDSIRGSVILNVERSMRITHLTICLHGVVKVFKNGKIPNESNSRWRAYLASGQGKWGDTYFGNGLAALFKDEITLSGDGCLVASSYRFRFELELPSHALPSSIDFQHGLISYMLSATLTRPTTILPTSRCEHPVILRESIDIATLPQPSAQTIPLESVQKRPRGTKTALGGKKSSTASQPQSHGSTKSRAVSENSDESPQSRSPSDISCPSIASSCNTVYNTGQATPNSSSTEKKDTDTMTKTMTPTATVEILQSGYLPGDIVTLRVSASLNRRVKSLHGIIITLYRECHVDIHPAIPLGPSERGKGQEYEDYYPRSRTGLGGLSLSSGGSSRVFRQDINQTFTPLVIDPRTFTANVKTSVKIPENVFPTITSVPGAMIEFKYYVEAVIDLRGKSPGQERILPRLSMVNAVPSFAPGDPTLNPLEGYDGVKLPFNSGFCFLETSQIRREKGVLTHISEIVVGTCDSSRQRSKLMDRTSRSIPIDVGFTGEPEARFIPTTDDVDEEQQYYRRYENRPFDEHIFSNQPLDYPGPGYVPPPEAEDHVNEKTRLQRAERLLLPSAPPDDMGDLSSATTSNQASAPMNFDDYDFVARGRRPEPSAPAYEEPSASSQETTTSLEPRDTQLNGQYHAPTTEFFEDKQELERQRLQAQASSPEGDIATTESSRDAQATAPVLDEDPSHALSASFMRTQQRSSERLPQYHK